MTNQSKPENFQTKESKTENLQTKQPKLCNKIINAWEFQTKQSKSRNFRQNSQSLELSTKTVLFVIYAALATQLFSLRRVKIYIQISSEQFHKPCRKVDVVVTFINVPTNIRTP